MTEFPMLIGLIVYIVSAFAWLYFSHKAWEREQEESCPKYDRDWQENEEEMNQRMDIIGQNGNTGEHYDEEAH